MVQLSAECEHHRDSSIVPRYLQTTQFSDVAGEDILLFNPDGVHFQIGNVYDGGMGFGHRVEFSALRKMKQMLQNGVPQWTETELMVIKELYERTDREYV